ncbi:ceramide phosphoethanolamine synthase [Diprion similis]|uniref:ceramide phosphoethanolamine synthase n=1 Tax=Diprion similis TaxID=362088 RepID=UPI001EF7AC6D|nr:ceramide phosphoethanolamine synthase [Diprion similis]
MPKTTMLGPNAVCSRLFLALLILTLSYFVYMNYLLFVRVRDYAIRRNSDGTPTDTSYHNSYISCDVNPICDVTVKSLMLDNPNHYLLSPLAVIVDRVLKISQQSWISPNEISAFHVLVAVAAGKCVSSDSLSHRRFGVVLFMIRSWLDDLDGHVARQRKNIRGEYSEVGSIGYWVDGICDSLGVLSLIIGVYYFIKVNPPRRGYEKLLPVIESKDLGSGKLYKKKTPLGRAAPKVLLLFVGQLMLSSAGWNRYIALYQDLLEGQPSQGHQNSITGSSLPLSQEDIQLTVFRSNPFWAITLSWTLVNAHALTDYLLLAIFTDRLWEYVSSIRYLGYVVLFTVLGVTEYHYRNLCQEFFDPATSAHVESEQSLTHVENISYRLT